MAASVLNAILDAVVARVEALALGAVAVEKRKLPKAEEGVETLPVIAVSLAERGGDAKWLCFGRVNVMYPVEVTVISANNADQVTGLDVAAAWRQRILAAFNVPGSSPYGVVPTAWKQKAEPGVFLDRSLIPEMYDFQQVLLKVWSAEVPS